jgi:hypothetical protein
MLNNKIKVEYVGTRYEDWEVNVICLGLCPAGDFGTSGVEPSGSVNSTASFCEPFVAFMRSS